MFLKNLQITETKLLYNNSQIGKYIERYLRCIERKEMLNHLRNVKYWQSNKKVWLEVDEIQESRNKEAENQSIKFAESFQITRIHSRKKDFSPTMHNYKCSKLYNWNYN